MWILISQHCQWLNVSILLNGLEECLTQRKHYPTVSFMRGKKKRVGKYKLPCREIQVSFFSLLKDSFRTFNLLHVVTANPSKCLFERLGKILIQKDLHNMRLDGKRIWWQSDGWGLNKRIICWVFNLCQALCNTLQFHSMYVKCVLRKISYY